MFTRDYYCCFLLNDFNYCNKKIIIIFNIDHLLLTKPKHYCIVWNEPLQALVSMSMDTKLNTCTLIKQATIPHWTKLVEKFTYLGSSVSPTEKNIDTRLTKAWTAIDKLSIIWKSDLTDKMKCSFFQVGMDALFGR